MKFGRKRAENAVKSKKEKKAKKKSKKYGVKILYKVSRQLNVK
jgi:hypothetical protein